MNITKRLKSLRILSVTLAVVLAVIAAVPERSEANVGHVLLGGLAGAGIVLAWPTITAGVGALCAGVGTVAAGATAAVAAGGAAVGGAVVGAGAVAGGAITSAFGAIGGAIAAVTASPLFVPALIIIAVAVGGYLIYRAIKKSKENKPMRITESTISETSSPTPTRVTETSVATTESNGTTVATTTGLTPDARNAHEIYQASYRRYIQALQTDETGSQPGTQQALQELRQAETAYRACMDASGK